MINELLEVMVAVDSEDSILMMVVIISSRIAAFFKISKKFERCTFNSPIIHFPVEFLRFFSTRKDMINETVGWPGPNCGAIFGKFILKSKKG